MWICYILHSDFLDRYYIGSTGDNILERLRRHNTNHSGFTGGAGDWKIVFQERLISKLEALARERQIKKWKSRKKIEQLIGV